MTKTKVVFLKGRLISRQLEFSHSETNQPIQPTLLKSIQKALIGWKKVGPLKSHFCLDHVNRL